MSTILRKGRYVTKITLDQLSSEVQERARALGLSGFIVTPHGTLGVKTSPMWGTRLVQTINPLGTDIPETLRNTLSLINPFPRIPAPLWQRWVKLCFHFCDPSRGDKNGIDSRSEVSCRFSRRHDDPTKWSCWIPKQEVGGGTVHAVMSKLVNIESGDVIESWPPEGEFDAGSSHSHNTMSAFFSGIDDASELGSPGFHAVVGSIDRKEKSYEVTASIVLDKKRYIIEPYDTIIDGSSGPEYLDVTFHPNVLTVVSKYQYSGYGGSSWHGGSTGGGSSTYRDPLLPGYTSYPDKSDKADSPRLGPTGLSENTQARATQIAAACSRVEILFTRLMSEVDGLEALQALMKAKYGLELKAPETEKKDKAETKAPAENN
jgi:hypothetical protein